MAYYFSILSVYMDNFASVKQNNANKEGGGAFYKFAYNVNLKSSSSQNVYFSFGYSRNKIVMRYMTHLERYCLTLVTGDRKLI